MGNQERENGKRGWGKEGKWKGVQRGKGGGLRNLVEEKQNNPL